MTATNYPPDPYYLQINESWANDTVGGSQEPLSAVGCTVCCVSMAFTQCGQQIDPGILNAKLNANGRYTERGWLIWSVASAVVDKGLKIDVASRPSHDLIDSSLRQGDPVVAKILLWKSVPHWVLIVGKDKHEYLVKNPLDEQKRIQDLSSLSDRIQSIRIVKRTVE